MFSFDPMIENRRAESETSFSFVLERAREEVRLQAIGELDLAAAPALNEQVDELLDAGFRQVVIDLRRLTFVDLAGVRLLLKLAQDATDDGWRLSMTEAGGQVHQLLTLTGAIDQMPFRGPLVGLPALAPA
jgi:anti-sigma B factor antagonist